MINIIPYCTYYSLGPTFLIVFIAAQQRKPGIITPNRLATTNAVLSRSYNVIPSTSHRAISATQIARELLHTQGIQGLYKGLGATLLR